MKNQKYTVGYVVELDIDESSSGLSSEETSFWPNKFFRRTYVNEDSFIINLFFHRTNKIDRILIIRKVRNKPAIDSIVIAVDDESDD